MEWRASARQNGDRRAEARRSTSTLARAVSLLFHPLVLSPLTVALTSRSWRWTAIIVVSTMVPITAAILWNVRRGVWSDFDVTHRRQRSGLYRVAIPLFLAAIFFVPAPGWFDRPLIALVAVLIVCFVLSRWLQVSLHLMFAAFCAVILWRAFPLSAVAMACVLAGLAWARLHLEHHTLPEVVVGTLFGLAAGIFTIS